MLEKTVNFDDKNSWEDYGIVFESLVVGKAEPQLVMIDVPFRNGSLDETDYFGDVRYKNRTITMGFLIPWWSDDQYEIFAKVQNQLNGKRKIITFSADEDWHYEGRLTVGDFKIDNGFFKFEITAVCDPYRYKDSTVIETIGSYEELTGDIVQLDAGMQFNLTSVVADINAVQDLHGYANPWVGGAGKNLFDELYPSISGSLIYKSIYVGDGTFTMSTTAPRVQGSANLFFFTGQTTSGANTNTNGVWSGQNRTIQSTNGYVTVAYRILGDDMTYSPANYKTQIEKGSSATSYEPYSNICPINGFSEVKVNVAGKNLLPTTPQDIGTFSGVTVTRNADGTVTLNGTATANNVVRIGTVRLKGGYAYTVTGAGTGASDTTHFLNIAPTFSGASNQNIHSSYSGTPTQEREYAFRIYYRSGAVLNNVVYSPMVRLSSTDSSYEPYIGNTYTTALGQTVYGGRLNVTTGELTVTTAYITMPNASGTSTTNNVRRFYTTPLATYNDVIACDSYNVLFDSSSVGNIMWTTSDKRIVVTPSWAQSITNVNDFNTELVNHQFHIVMELATPQTYQLTPQEVRTVLGQNYIWADSGDVTVTYSDPIQLDNDYMKTVPTITNSIPVNVYFKNNAYNFSPGSHKNSSIILDEGTNYISIVPSEETSQPSTVKIDYKQGRL